MDLNHEKNKSRKSRDTLPLKIERWREMCARCGISLANYGPGKWLCMCICLTPNHACEMYVHIHHQWPKLGIATHGGSLEPR